MRPAAAMMVGLAMTVVLVAPGSASAAGGQALKTQPVRGEMTGPGSFRVNYCGGTIAEAGTGTYVARGLGRGDYAFDICITTETAGFSYLGWLSFTTRSGAQLHGIVAGTSPSGGTPAFTVWVDSGTRRFASARGILTMGPLTQSSQTNCDPRVGICFNWIDTGPITGTLRDVRR